MPQSPDKQDDRDDAGKPSGPDDGPRDLEAPAAPGRRRGLLLVVGGLLAALAIVAVVLIATHKDKKPVPAVVGQDLAAAQQILDDDGFEVRARRVVNVAAPDRVLGQDPLAGEKADKDSTVTLTVSSGPGAGTVPDVAELPESRAERALRQAGFAPRSAREYSSAVAAGRAIRTRPPAGTRLERTRPVVVTVSRGPQQVVVPDVEGDTEGAARRAIQQAGLRLELVQERSNRDPGSVVAQAPAAGAQVTIGSAVRIVVDKAPRPVNVPNVQGEPVEDAVSSLSNLGLAVFFRTKLVTSSSQNGVVLRQQPAAGAKANPGSRVILQVGKLESAPPQPATTPTAPTAPTAAPATATG